MNKAEKANVGMMAAASAAPVLLAPQTAWAASDPAVLLAAGLSGIVGACVGASVAGGVGYVALKRQREAFEIELAGRAPVAAPGEETNSLAAQSTSVAAESAPKARHAAGPRVAPGHAALTAESEVLAPAASPVAAAPAKRVRNPYLDPEDLDSVAMAYAAKKSLRERMASRAKGVTQVLNERLGKNVLDDMPVILRADGSRGDVGTSWWDVRASEYPEPAKIHVPPALDQVVPAPAQVSATQTAPKTAPAHAPQIMPNAAPRMAPAAQAAAHAAPKAAPAPSAGASVSRIIAARVAPIELDAYPEIENAWSSRDDRWEASLAALDERVEDNLMGERLERAYQRISSEQAPRAFGDGIGNEETLDEPDGLERDTAFLSFKAPGNHPEVQDTASYINYLIGDEFRRNPSSQARRHARSYLRLHEGGTHAQAKAVV